MDAKANAEPETVSSGIAFRSMDEFKARCLRDVLANYPHLLRPGVYAGDARFVFLLCMCRAIDLAKRSSQSSPSSSSDERDAPFDLESMSYSFDRYSEETNTPARQGSFDYEDRIGFMTDFVLRSPFF